MSTSKPPVLPPRGRSPIPQAPPPPYSEMSTAKQKEMIAGQWLERDPRSSSMHSLVPDHSACDGKRTLLLIYIHGFMGNETSFQSFPAHVHNLLTMTMAETHAVHSKIYPRYKSKKKINFAVEDFSQWLRPHENASTDIILLGHSMGGILEVDVTLLPSTNAITGQHFRHRIIGTINFDTPFLGMHPGLVTSGIASLFRPAPKMPNAPSSSTAATSLQSQTTSATQSTTVLPTEWSDSSTTLSTMESSILSPVQSAITNERPDPNFDSPFANDIKLEKRSGWGNMWHFVNKHMEEGLTGATKQYFVSHLEFGGCLADVAGLKNRYAKARALEDGQAGHRVRFVNYYTASTGRVKESKKIVSDNGMEGIDIMQRAVSEESALTAATNDSNSLLSGTSPFIETNGTSSPMPNFQRQSNDQNATASSITDLHNSNVHTQLEHLGRDSGVHEVSEDQSEEQLSSEDSDNDSTRSMRHVESMPIPDSDDEFHDAGESSIATNSATCPPLSTAESITEDITALEIGKTHADTASTSAPSSNLPPIIDLPVEPLALDLSRYTDKDSKKLAEKEHKSSVKTYQKAVKDREIAIRDREKLVEKRERKYKLEVERLEKEEQKAREKTARAEEKKRLRELKEQKKHDEKARKDAESNLSGEEKRLLAEARRLREEADRMEREAARMRGDALPASTSIPKLSLDEGSTTEVDDQNSMRMTTTSSLHSLTAVTSDQTKSATPVSASKASKTIKPVKAEKVKKDRKFCLLPSDIGGKADKCWVRVYMEGVDEVGAHCGLFFRGPQYESLVEDVGQRIREWVLESGNA